MKCLSLEPIAGEKSNGNRTNLIRKILPKSSLSQYLINLTRDTLNFCIRAIIIVEEEGKLNLFRSVRVHLFLVMQIDNLTFLSLIGGPILGELNFHL